MAEPFDNQIYWALMAEDAREGTKYLNRYIYEHPNPEALLSYAANKVIEREQTDQQTAATEKFLAEHDFPQGDENAVQMMVDRVGQLQSQNMPFGTNLMEMAYFQLVSEGKIQQAGDQQQHNSPPELTEEQIASAEQLPDAELRKLLESAGMFR